MKNTILLAVAILVFGTVANAQVAQETAIKKEIKNLNQKETKVKEEKQAERKALRKLEGNEVSSRSKQQFTKSYGSTAKNVVWKRVANFDEVTFSNKGKQMTAFYDGDSNLVGTTTDEKFADLPVKAQTEINKKYKDYQKVAVVLYDDNESNDTDMVLYGKQFEDKDSHFVELQKDAKKIALQVSTSGEVAVFTNMK